MAVLFHSPDEDAHAWRRALEARLPGIELRISPEIGDPAGIEAALANEHKQLWPLVTASIICWLIALTIILWWKPSSRPGASGHR